MNWLITIFLSLTPFFWQRDDLQLQLLGYGDFLSPINAFQEISNRLFMFYPHVGAGSNIAFLTSHLFPFLSWHAVFSFFHFSPLIASLAFFSLILFCSQISMEAWMNYIFSFQLKVKKEHRRIFSFCIGRLYAFAPLCIWLIAPGHVYQLIMYALFPWILLLIDTLLMNRLPKKIVLPKLFFLFLCCAPSFANIGILYVLFVIFFFYIVTYWVTKRISSLHAIFVFILITACAIAANIWWLFPYLYSITETISINYKSNLINANISGSAGAAYMLNIFLGHPESLLYLSAKYKIFLSIFFEIGTLGFWILCFALLRYWKKYTYSIVCLIMILIGFFIVKGNQPPFSVAFVWLYDHFPGFQIFRRPVSKYYWVYWFFFITLAMGSAGIFYEKYLKRNKLISNIIVLFISIFTCGIIFAFMITNEQHAFSVPQYYYEASAYLEKNTATRVVLLPDLNGLNPSFKNQFIQYNGVEFFPFLVKAEVLIPDSTNYSVNLFSKPIVNTMVLQLQNNQSFCETAGKLGISHIILRHDLILESTTQYPPEIIHKQLISSPDISAFHFFNPDTSNQGISVYDIRPECRRDLIQTSSGTVTSQTIFPGLMSITIKNAEPGVRVKMLYNYSGLWAAYKEVRPFKLPVCFRATQLLLHDTLNTLFKRPQDALPHMLVDDYANGWTVDHTNASNVNIIMIYRLQYIFYFGIFIFIAVIFVWRFYVRHKVWKK